MSQNQTSRPSPTDVDGGRGVRGRFAKGNRFSRGNPHASKVQKLRSALYEAVSCEDLQSVVQEVVKAARGGDIQACRLLFDRLLGQVTAADFEERLFELEQILEGQES